MERKKVFVLMRDSMTRGEQAIDLQTFDTKAKAEKTMKDLFVAELNDWKSWCDEDFIEAEESENSRSIYEIGNYHENHYELSIHEQVVQ